jgi:hypothetical protein
MKSVLKDTFDAEMAAAYRAFHAGRLDESFRHLETAHILGQSYVMPHVRTHWLMLRIGWSRHSVREVWGQAMRIVLGALGSALGIVPIGNTGGTNISMFKRLPISPALAALLEGAKGKRRDP